MTIQVVQSNLTNFPSIPYINSEDPPNEAKLPPVWESIEEWGVTLSFVALEYDATTDDEVPRPVTAVNVPEQPTSDNDWLFNFEASYTKPTNTTLRVVGPSLNVFMDSAYVFNLKHSNAQFRVDSSGTVVEVQQFPGPNENDPNVTIDDDDFVQPPRPFGQVQIIDTGSFSQPSDPSFPNGIVAVSLPRYFQRKLRPTTELPWVSFVRYIDPSVKQTTKSFTVEVTYTSIIGGSVTETVTISQDVYWKYDSVIGIINALAANRREP